MIFNYSNSVGHRWPPRQSTCQSIHLQSGRSTDNSVYIRNVFTCHSPLGTYQQKYRLTGYRPSCYVTPCHTDRRVKKAFGHDHPPVTIRSDSPSRSSPILPLLLQTISICRIPLSLMLDAPCYITNVAVHENQKPLYSSRRNRTIQLRYQNTFTV